jgi:hypothetical protein
MRFYLAAAVVAALPTAALAAPGQGDEVYGATVEKGEFELEARYGELDGGADDGEAVLKLEAAYGVSERLRLGLVGEIEHEPGSNAEVEAIGIEAIYALGKLGPFDVAAYGEYEIALDGPDKIETKLLLQHREGPIDLRFNLIAEKELAGGKPVEFEYAASADAAAFGELRLGVQAYGELGTTRHFLPRSEHFA